MTATHIFHQPTRYRAGQLAITAGTVNKRQLAKVERRYAPGEACHA